MSATIFLSPALIAGNGNALIKGKIRYTDGQPLMEPVELRLVRLNRLEFTDDTGSFRLETVPLGKLSVQLFVRGELTDSFLLSVDDTLIELGSLHLIPLSFRSLPAEIPQAAEQDPAPITTQDDALQPQPAMLLNGKDVFMGNAFSLVSSGYRPRGYNNYPTTHLIGGVLFDDLLNQPTSFLWSGLTDIMRNQRVSVNLEYNPDAAAGLTGLTNTFLHAYYQRPSRKIAYSIGNRSYDHKIQVCYTGELTPRGWTLSFSGFRQWALETYVPGTSSDYWAAYLSVSKEFARGGIFSITLLYNNNIRTPRSAATDELFTLSGSNLYNANWGWQNGLKRNARSVSARSPMAVMEYCKRSSEKLEWCSAFALSFMETEYAGLDWFRAPDPRPDYYRNLPSFIAKNNPSGAGRVAQKFFFNPDLLQIDWKRIYEANANNWDSVSYYREDVRQTKWGRQALYVQAADVTKSSNIFLRSALKYHFGKGNQINMAFAWNEHFSERFKVLKDLLGADYFLDINDFARQEFPLQSKYWANDADRLFFPLTRNDHYKYDYAVRARLLQSNVQWEKDFRKWTLFTSIEARIAGYGRNGHIKNGLNLDRSYGKSRTIYFPGYHLKMGITRKINGRQYISARFFHGLVPPANFDQVFIAPSIRDLVASRYAEISSRLTAAEIVYTIHAPRFNLQLSGYQTEVRNGVQIFRFYNDDPQYQCFADMVQTRIGQRHTGIEISLTYSVNSRLSTYLLGATGQSFFTRNPEVFLLSENDTGINPQRQSVKIQNYFSVTGPQTVGGLGVQLEGKQHWSIRAGLGILDQNYVRINPSRRTSRASAGLDPQSAEAQAIFQQEKLAPTYTSDVMLSKSLRIKNVVGRTNLNLFCFLTMANVLDFRNQKSFGYEQLRYDYAESDPSKFPNKYIYGPGRTFSCGIQIKW
jgi:hypothetical protein